MNTRDMAWKVANQFGDLHAVAGMMAHALGELTRPGGPTPEQYAGVIDMVLTRFKEVNADIMREVK